MWRLSLFNSRRIYRHFRITAVSAQIPWVGKLVLDGEQVHGYGDQSQPPAFHRYCGYDNYSCSIRRGYFRENATRFISSTRATTWLNSPPLTDANLQGKVVLVEFWTYSCINWRRQLPYVRAWAEEYRDQGLVVVGVHSPEFSFEKNIDNIRWAAKDMRVAYPIAVDNDHAVWRGFNNEYWPALYFADAKGKIKHHPFGEGQHEQSEKVIQKLLAEAGGSGHNVLVSVHANGAEAVADWNNLKSGENYVGYGRTENFSSSGGASRTSVMSTLSPKRWILIAGLYPVFGQWVESHRTKSSERPHCIPVSCTRPSSSDGTICGWDFRAVSRAYGWVPARKCSRCRCGRPGQRHCY